VNGDADDVPLASVASAFCVRLMTTLRSGVNDSYMENAMFHMLGEIGSEDDDDSIVADADLGFFLAFFSFSGANSGIMRTLSVLGAPRTSLIFKRLQSKNSKCTNPGYSLAEYDSGRRCS
jgi:hypothetical protein